LHYLVVNTQLERTPSYPCVRILRWSLLPLLLYRHFTRAVVALCAALFVSCTPSLHRPWWIPLTLWWLWAAFGFVLSVKAKFAVDGSRCCCTTSDSYRPLFSSTGFRWRPWESRSYFSPCRMLSSRAWGFGLPFHLGCAYCSMVHWRVGATFNRAAAASSPSSLVAKPMVKLAFWPSEVDADAVLIRWQCLGACSDVSLRGLPLLTFFGTEAI